MKEERMKKKKLLRETHEWINIFFTLVSLRLFFLAILFFTTQVLSNSSKKSISNHTSKKINFPIVKQTHKI